MKPLNLELWNSCVVYDVEIINLPQEVEGGWDNPEAMKMSCCVVYIPGLNRFRFFDHSEVELERLRILLTRAKYRVGFNSIRFDNRVIFGNNYEQPPWLGKENDVDLLQVFALAEFPECDSYQEVDQKIKGFHKGGVRSLDKYVQNTINRKKTGHGANAPWLFRDGKWAELWEYCLNDVVVTAELLKFAIDNGYVIQGEGKKVGLR